MHAKRFTLQGDGKSRGSKLKKPAEVCDAWLAVPLELLRCGVGPRVPAMVYALDGGPSVAVLDFVM